MTPAEAHILARRLRRDYHLAGLAKVGLLSVVALWVAMAVARPPLAESTQTLLWFTGLAAFVAWIMLTTLGVRQVHATNRASMMVAAGRLDLAEEHLVQTLRQFGIYRASKLLACHCLAVVVHGQKEYEAAAELCRAVVALGRTRSRPVARLCRILLADCSMVLGDIPAAVTALEPLRPRPISIERRGSQELSLAEQMLLLPIDLRCRIITGDLDRATADLVWRIRVAEILDSSRAAVAHALLAEACRRQGREVLAAFLRRRAELYHDLSELAATYPALADVLAGPVDRSAR